MITSLKLLQIEKAAADALDQGIESGTYINSEILEICQVAKRRLSAVDLEDEVAKFLLYGDRKGLDRVLKKYRRSLHE